MKGWCAWSQCGLQIADNPVVCEAYGLCRLAMLTGCRFCETPLDKQKVIMKGEVECGFQDGVNVMKRLEEEHGLEATVV